MEKIGTRRAVDADRDVLIEAIIDQQDYERKLHDTRRPGVEIARAYLGFIKESATRNHGAVVVAELDGAFAGYAACWIEHEYNVTETDDSNHYGYVADVYVIPRLRGRGVVAVLLEAVESHLRSIGVRRIRITALAGNTSALRAYGKHGFESYEVVMEKRVHP